MIQQYLGISPDKLIKAGWETMYMVGFSDSSYFSKCFVEKYGKTPRQYMENM